MCLGDAIKLHKFKKRIFNVEPKIFEKKCEDIWQAKIRGCEVTWQITVLSGGLLYYNIDLSIILWVVIIDFHDEFK